MSQSPSAEGASLYTIESANALEDLTEVPAYLMPAHERGVPQIGRISCSYCGLGDGGRIDRVPETPPPADGIPVAGDGGRLWIEGGAERGPYEAKALEHGVLHVSTRVPIVAPGGVVRGRVRRAAAHACRSWARRSSEREPTTGGSKRTISAPSPNA